MNTIPPSIPVFAQPGNVASPPPVPGGDSRVPGATGSAAGSDRTSEATSPRQQSSPTEQGLSPEELKQLTELKARDREVRAHEQAHQAVGGQYAGAISYTFQRGPDGAQYAVGGEVSIDVSPVAGDPQATIEKMRVVRAAALAPAEPSGQDRAVAAEAMQIMLKAQAEVASGDDSQPLGSQSRTGQQAEGTYQSVSAMTDEPQRQSSGFPSVAA